MEHKVIIGWHGTLASRFIKIQESGFDLKQFTCSKGKMTLPGDLGYGTYLFVEDTVLSYNPKDYAAKFLETYKNKYENEFCLLKVTVKEENLLDLDLEENIKVYSDLREKLKIQIEQRAKDLAPNGTLKRGNFDGLYIEVILEYLKEIEGIEVKLVTKRTFTDFKEKVGVFNVNRSNFANGKELVIRDTELVLNYEEEVI